MASKYESFSLIFTKSGSMFHCTVYFSSSKMILWYLFIHFKSTRISVVFNIKIFAGNIFYICKKTPVKSLKSNFFMRAIPVTCTRDLVTSLKIPNKCNDRSKNSLFNMWLLLWLLLTWCWSLVDRHMYNVKNITYHKEVHAGMYKLCVLDAKSRGSSSCNYGAAYKNNYLEIQSWHQNIPLLLSL